MSVMANLLEHSMVKTACCGTCTRVSSPLIIVILWLMLCSQDKLLLSSAVSRTLPSVDVHADPFSPWLHFTLPSVTSLYYSNKPTHWFSFCSTPVSSSWVLLIHLCFYLYSYVWILVFSWPGISKCRIGLLVLKKRELGMVPRHSAVWGSWAQKFETSNKALSQKNKNKNLWQKERGITCAS